LNSQTEKHTDKKYMCSSRHLFIWVSQLPNKRSGTASSQTGCHLWQQTSSLRAPNYW